MFIKKQKYGDVVESFKIIILFSSEIKLGIESKLFL